jgi:serine/threonine protein kinase
MRRRAVLSHSAFPIRPYIDVVTIPSELASALPERYELRSVLGRGGMATVYLAYDRKHQREVALKVLRPEVAASLGVERFLTEIQIVARLVHPHILTLHDSGVGAREAGGEGFVYYVMPYIEGGSLRQRLESRRFADVDEVLMIAESVAGALSYAHRVGVLHRDIKPENILFAQDHPIVADFGIAKAVSTASSGARLTRTGISLGTPGYMSPEQAAGFTDVDERTDVYSLAVVVYEMLVGDIPGRWLTEDSVRSGRFQDAVPKHRARLAMCGNQIEGALARGLAVRPDQRTPTPAALIDDLRGVAKSGRRRYRPDEIDEIVKRASELEASNPTTSGSMTIGGVESIARDVGISPTLIRSAAKSIEPRTTSREIASNAPQPATTLNRVMGGPTRLRLDRVIEGELDESDYLALVDEIRRTIQNVGQVSQLGRSFTWTLSRGASGGRDLEIAVSIRSGRTHIAIQENLVNLAGGIWGGVGGGMGGGGMGPILGTLIGGMHAPELAIVVVPAWLAVTFVTARTSYRLMTRRRYKTLEALIDRLASITAELIAERRPRLKSPERVS